MTPAPESGRYRRRAKALVLASALAASTGLSVASAAPASAAPNLMPGETASKGMTLLKNLPKTGAFAPEGAFNSDLAFKGDYAFAGNYEGFTVYDITNPRQTREVIQVACSGSQNDVSVFGDLLFLSVDSRRNDDSCQSRSLSTARSTTVGPNLTEAQAAENKAANDADRLALQEGRYFEGIRIFDITDPRNPKYVKAVATDCGSHTHTLVPSGKDMLVYVSSYDVNADAKFCKSTPDETPANNTAHDIISIIKVPGSNVAGARAASVIAKPRLFNPGNPGGVTPGTEQFTNAQGEPRIRYSNTRGCHDITAYPQKGIAAGACMGEGVLMDIRKPEAPKIISRALDTENFAFWHSATFNNAASTVMFTDELGGGGGATCNPPTQAYPHLTIDRGANAYYTIGADKSLTKRAYFKIPREQGLTENCVAHNGSLVPAKDRGQIRDVMVQSWYQGGISVVDFTNPRGPRELAYFDRGALSNDRLILGGSWSAYYYKGFVYSNDIQKGLDVLEITVPSLRNAKSGRFPNDYNPQSQPILGNR